MIELSEQQSHLVEACRKAHAATALRGNISHTTLVGAAMGSGDYFKSIAAALMTTGNLHAPLCQTYALLIDPNPIAMVENMLKTGRKVPGWGNAFEKNEADPAWKQCAKLIEEYDGNLAKNISLITVMFHSLGKWIFPNPSCYTAATAICIGLPAEACGYLFLSGRLDAWTEEFIKVRASQGII